jgi:hypothetical protein
LSSPPPAGLGFRTLQVHAEPFSNSVFIATVI